MKSKRRMVILVAVLAISGLISYLWKIEIFNLDVKRARWAVLGGALIGEEESEIRRPRLRERAKTKIVQELSSRDLDLFLEARGVHAASVLFVLLNSSDPKYRDLAIRLPDSPLKYMMLSMDISDDPKQRMEWSKKLYELDPLNRVSTLRYVSQLMDCGEKEKAAEVLATVKNCDHTSNNFDLLIGEFEFARNFFGNDRFGPLAVQVARIWPVRTAHYTVENYMDSLEFSGAVNKASTAAIHDRAKDYLLEVGYSDADVESVALIQTRLLLASFRSESKDPIFKKQISDEIADIQVRSDALFTSGLDYYETVEKHRSAAEDMDHVIENMSRWKVRKVNQ